MPDVWDDFYEDDNFTGNFESYEDLYGEEPKPSDKEVNAAQHRFEAEQLDRANRVDGHTRRTRLVIPSILKMEED
ncbi:MAG: hypothetical protein WC882_02410 [Candidatus Gracilibacteria bacterium]